MENTQELIRIILNNYRQASEDLKRYTEYMEKEKNNAVIR